MWARHCDVQIRNLDPGHAPPKQLLMARDYILEPMMFGHPPTACVPDKPSSTYSSRSSICEPIDAHGARVVGIAGLGLADREVVPILRGLVVLEAREEAFH